MSSAIDRVRSSSDTETDTRPERMRDWLIRQINSGKFPGLEWLNEEKNVFKVPWIHAKKRGYNRERDAALFRAWAMHSGKYRDESDPTVWKINFRCAINGLKDIQEIKDMQTEDCRVYRVHPSTGRKRSRVAKRARFASTEPYPSPNGHNYEATPHIYTPVCATDAMFTSQHYTPAGIKLEYPEISACTHTTLAGYPTHCISSAGLTIPTSSCIVDPQMSNYGTSVLSSYSCVPSTGISIPDGHISESPTQQPQGTFFGEPAPLPPVATIISEASIPLSPDSGIAVESQNSPAPLIPSSPPMLASDQQAYSPTSSLSSISSCRMNLPPCSVQSEFELNRNNQEIVQLVEELEELHSPIPASPKACELQVRVLYGSIPVLTQRINCTRGARVFFNPYQGQLPSLQSGEGGKYRKLFGPPEAKQISLPNCHPDPLATDIFKAMCRGLIIQMVDNDICVTPLCHTVVYCGQSSTSQSYALEKEQRTKVFDYVNHFRPSLEQYALFNGPPPNPSCIFSLGQSWGPGKHVAQNLISIVVTHLPAKHELDTIGLPHALARDLLMDLPESIEVEKPTYTDIEAEQYLNQYVTVHS